MEEARRDAGKRRWSCGCRRRRPPRKGTQMRKILATLAIAALLALAVAVPATAVTDGALDGNDHPYVGLMVAQDGGRSAAVALQLERCSRPRCCSPPATARRARAAHARDLVPGRRRRSRAIPAQRLPVHRASRRNVADRAPAVQPDARSTSTTSASSSSTRRWYHGHQYGDLPALNRSTPARRSAASSDVTFTAVGYGLQQAFPDAAWLEGVQRPGPRMVAHPKLDPDQRRHRRRLLAPALQQRQYRRDLLR